MSFEETSSDPPKEEVLGTDLLELLEGIPGMFERAERGIEEIKAGKGIPLEDL